MRATLVRGARQLVTLHGTSGPRRGADLKSLGIIQDGAVLIVDGEIRDVGPSRRVENLALARQAREIDAIGRVVMPGFVDSHTYLAGRRALGDAVRHGTTTLEARSDEIKILRAFRKQPIPVVCTFVYRNGTESDMLALLKRRKLAEFAAIRCEEVGFEEKDARRFLSVARDLGFGLKVHTGRRSNPGAVRLAVELGAASVDHVTDVTGEEAMLLAQSNTVATLLPAETFYLGREPYAPARMLIDSGAAVALASGFHPETSPCQSMQMILTLACRRMNMTPAEAIHAATLNAAYALRRDSSAGSLETGKRGDLIVVSVPDYREIPYHFGINLVDVVIKNGDVLVERSEVKWPAQ